MIPARELRRAVVSLSRATSWPLRDVLALELDDFVKWNAAAAEVLKAENNACRE